jgi:LPXTG-site transpeptidase (sortase) family protein
LITAIPGLGFRSGSTPGVTVSFPPAAADLAPPRHPNTLAGIDSGSLVGPNTVVALLTIPRLGIKSAPVYDRGVDSSGNMVIAHGYAVTHFAYSAGIGSGNAVLYGHDDIEGSVFGRLQELRPGDEVDVTNNGGSTVAYRVTGRSIVQPNAVQILEPTGDVRLTLFTCWPTWVDTQRVVITAQPAA